MPLVVPQPRTREVLIGDGTARELTVSTGWPRVTVARVVRVTDGQALLPTITTNAGTAVLTFVTPPAAGSVRVHLLEV